MLNINSSESYYNKGIIQFENGQYDLAIENFKKAIEKNSTNFNYYYNLGLAYIEIADYDAAIENFNAGIKLNSLDADLFHNLGIAYFNNNQIQKAISIYEKALKIKADDPDIYGNLGIAYFKLNNYDDAVLCFNKAVELSPQNSSFCYNLAYTYYEIEQYEIAKQFLLRTISLNNNDADAYYTLANVYLRQKDYLKAKENYKKVLSLIPNHIKAQSALAEIDKVEETLLPIEDIEDKEPNILEPEESQEVPEEVQEETPIKLLKAAAAKPKKELAVDMAIEAAKSYQIGIDYLNNSELELAIESLKNAVILCTDYKDAQEALEKATNLLNEGNNLFNLGVSLFAQNKFVKARECFKQALNIKPHDDQIIDMLGRAEKKTELIDKAKKDYSFCIEKGQYDLAAEIIQHLITEAPLDPDLHFQLGLIYIKQQKYTYAVKSLRKVLSIDPKHEDAQKTLFRLMKQINPNNN